MIKQTRAYRAALLQLADAIATQNPAQVDLSDVRWDIDDLMTQRHPDFMAAMNTAFDEAIQRRKQDTVAKRRAMLRKRKAEAA
jgi:hypothetical protein